MPEVQLTGGMRQAMAVLGVDRLTGEVFDALQAEQVPALLLKGPGIARWLYDDPGERPYGDVDLLVPAAREADAERVLRALGFSPDPGTGEPDPEGVARNHIWFRGSDHVELHVFLVGVRAAPERVWGPISDAPETLEVGGRAVPIPRPAARALHLALHAAQHGRAEAKPLDDLRRGLERLPEALWHEAAELARKLDAVPAFATGLALVPAGESLLARLDVSSGGDVDALLRARGEALALGFERIAKLAGPRAKLARLARIAFPPPNFMRWWSPLARRGPLGLAASYPRRWLHLVARGPHAFRAWRAAKREARR